eukprot:CAMPEP_0174251614 /NCGR_PEP_ID=MMETSP0439-20130205/1375_1 /TAXON_ID=0 /ORGANISM="Stereomyxa ramosa, Strain Chinc5" /LENGTH=107 /DNA_ID=CAMNT_0015331963 /DNA_START=47 /DNA_END=370 /DNA_ORIENTATION=+
MNWEPKVRRKRKVLLKNKKGGNVLSVQFYIVLIFFVWLTGLSVLFMFYTEKDQLSSTQDAVQELMSSVPQELLVRNPLKGNRPKPSQLLDDNEEESIEELDFDEEDY